MIYEAERGMTLQQAATAAIKADCDRMLYGGVVYDVDVRFSRVGKFVPDVPVTKSVEPSP